jgi:MFS transporter, DHA1 family, multidrug resistance protein
MTFKPDTLALTALLGILTALGPLSTDMYLPSLPSLTVALNSTPAEAQLTLSAFLFGFASTQIFYGPLSDRYGRRPALLTGLALFVVATLLCALAQTMPMLIAARFAQALGASGPIVLARAVARDLYSGRRAGQELALMASIMGIVPITAPTLGGVFEVLFGWRSTFVVAAAVGAVLFCIVLLRLPETLPPREGAPLTPFGMIRIFGRFIRDPRFLVYVSLVCCTYSGIFVFISVSSFVLQGYFGLTPLLYGVAFGVCSVGYVSGTLVGRKLSGHFGIDAGLGTGVSLMAAGGLALLAVTLTEVGGVYAVVAASTLFFAGCGAAMPQAMAGTLMPFPENAGAASSLMGVCQMFFGAMAGTLVATALDAGIFTREPMSLAAGTATIGVAAIVIYIGGWKIREAARSGE